MDKITVTRTSENIFRVRVESRTVTEHRVTVPPAYHQKLTGGNVGMETLVKRSFEFLLNREPNTSILREFELPLISHYFTDFENVISKGS